MFFNLLRLVDRYVFGALIVLLSPLKFFHGFRSTASVIAKPKKVLVIRLWALGSSLLTFPMIVRLREHYGEGVEYHLLASNRNISAFKNQGYFSKTFNLFAPKDFLALICRPKGYDVVVDAEEYFRISSLMALWCGKLSSGYSNIFTRSCAYVFPCAYREDRHIVENILSLAVPYGVSDKAPEAMEKLVYTSEDAKTADAFLVPYADAPYKVAFHAGGAETAPERFWAEDRWVALTELLVSEKSDVTVFFTGTKFEKAAIDSIFEKLSDNAKKRSVNVCGAFGVYPFARFLERMDATVSNDTGPMHLSAAMGTPTVGLFGPELPVRF